jgi:hypothetical protein
MFLRTIVSVVILSTMTSCHRANFWSEQKFDGELDECRRNGVEWHPYEGRCLEMNAYLVASFLAYVKVLWTAQHDILEGRMPFKDKYGSTWFDLYNHTHQTINRVADETRDIAFVAWFTAMLDSKREEHWLNKKMTYAVAVDEAYKLLRDQPHLAAQLLAAALVSNASKIVKTEKTTTDIYPTVELNNILLETENRLYHVIKFWNRYVNQDRALQISATHFISASEAALHAAEQRRQQQKP